jgi:hypothetical protein
MQLDRGCGIARLFSDNGDYSRKRSREAESGPSGKRFSIFMGVKRASQRKDWPD